MSGIMADRVTAYERAVESLERGGVRYCVLREGPHVDLGRKDLDILIHPHDLPLAASILRSSGFFFGRSPRDDRFKMTMLAPDEGGRALLDIHLKLVQNGLVYHDESLVLSRVRRLGGYRIPCPEDQFIHLLIHNLLGKGRIQAKHIPVIRGLVESGLDRRLIAESLEPFGISETLLQIADRWERCAVDESECRTARRRLLRRLLRANWRGWPGLAQIRFRAWVRRLSPRRRGTLLVFLGPDGTGKSALASEVSTRLSLLFLDEVPVRYMGPWSHHELPLARRVCRSPDNIDRGWRHLLNDLRRAQKGPPSRRRIPLRLKIRVMAKLLLDTPHERLAPEEDTVRRWLSDSSVLYTLAKYVFYHTRNAVDFAILGFDLWWRYARIYARLRRGDHVLADRYVYDLLSGATRDVTHKRRFLASLFCKLYPRPDACYLLWNEPDEIARRKQDLDADRAVMMLGFYEKVAARSGARRLKTDRPVGELADEIVRDNLEAILGKIYGPWTPASLDAVRQIRSATT